MTTVTSESASVTPPAESPARPHVMADPMPVAFALFAFALGLYFVRFESVSPATIAAGSTTVGLNYAVLVAGLAEVLGGVLGMIRGIGYPAYVTTTFGLWLIGFYLLVTSGAANKEFTTNALAWYSLMLIVPVAILAVPAFAHRNLLFMIAFVALIGLLLFLGLGYHATYNQLTSAAAHKTAPSLGSAADLLQGFGMVRTWRRNRHLERLCQGGLPNYWCLQESRELRRLHTTPTASIAASHHHRRARRTVSTSTSRRGLLLTAIPRSSASWRSARGSSTSDRLAVGPGRCSPIRKATNSACCVRNRTSSTEVWSSEAADTSSSEPARVPGRSRLMLRAAAP